ncbi:MAG: hypothetical protein KAX44_05710, partial [Candidatus Brocadiae bacterium]|nr:hypothetical protein [Candidatus Brocadiia bacterium]
AGILDGFAEEVRFVLGEVEAAGVAAATFRVCGRPGSGGICLSADGSAALADLAFRRGMLEAGVGELDSLYSVFVPADAGLLPHDVRGVVRASGADIAGGLLGEGTADSVAFAVSVGAFDGELSGRLSGVDLSEVEADVVLSVRNVEAQVPFGSGAPPVNVPAVSCDLAGRVRSNPLAGDLWLADLCLEMPGIARLEVPSLALAGFGGDALEGTARLRLDDLGGLVRLAADVLPVEMAEALPELEGLLSVEAEVAGRMPLARRVVAALETGGALPAVEFLPLGAFYERDAPLDVTLKCRVERVEARHHIREGLTVDVKVDDSQLDLALRDGDVSGRMAVNVPAVSFGRFPGEPWDMSLAARFEMHDFDDLTISDVVFDSMGALTVRGAMRASGLSGLVGSRLPQSLLEGTDVVLRLSGALRPGSLGLPEGLVVGGEACWDLDLILAGGRGLSLALRPRLDGVSVAFGDLLSVQGLDGRCTFSKVWDVVGPQQLAAERASLSQTMIATVPASSGPDLRAVIPEFATAVDGLAPPADRLCVETIGFMGHELVSDLETELAVRGATFAVPRFHLGLLGGQMVGAASFHPAPGGRELSLQGEFAGVDFRWMLPPGLRAFRGDAEVTGNFLLDALVSGSPAEGATPNPIKDVAGRLDVTHIGSAALDRLLLSL